MKFQKVFIRSLFLAASLVILLPAEDCAAQRNASKHFEKSVFGKSRKAKPIDDRIKAKGKAGKAMKEQARKQEERKAEGNKTMNKRRQRHFQIQSAETQQRMINNQKNTEAKYKAKNQKQKKEQSKPRKHKHRKP